MEVQEALTIAEQIIGDKFDIAQALIHAWHDGVNVGIDEMKTLLEPKV